MAINKIKVSETPKVDNINNFIVLGVNIGTNESAHADMVQLRGNVGLTPDISIIVNAIPYGTPPTVDKTGTPEVPVFTIGFPLAENGEKPLLRKTDTAIQYRYNESEEWTDLVLLDDIRFHYSDFTEAQIIELQRPATEAAEAANTAATNANEKGQLAESAATNANEKAALAEEKAAIAQTSADNANAATESAITATTNAVTATGLAITATENANTATTNANNATTNANDAAEEAKELNEHPPIIQNGRWYVWNTSTNVYEDTGVTAQGKALVVLPNGNYGNWDDQTGQYIDSGIPAYTSIDLQNIPVYFDEADEPGLIESGQPVPDAFGKLLKLQNDLGGLALKDTVDYNTEVTNKPEITSKTYIDNADSSLGLRIDAAEKIANKKAISANSGASEYPTSVSVWSLIQDVIATIPPGGLKVPLSKSLESTLPNVSTLSPGDNFSIQNMDVTAPGRTGRAWVNYQDQDDTSTPLVYYKVVDQYQTMDGVSITQTGSGAWEVNRLWLDGIISSAITPVSNRVTALETTIGTVNSELETRLNGQ